MIRVRYKTSIWSAGKKSINKIFTFEITVIQLNLFLYTLQLTNGWFKDDSNTQKVLSYLSQNIYAILLEPGIQYGRKMIMNLATADLGLNI